MESSEEASRAASAGCVLSPARRLPVPSRHPLSPSSRLPERPCRRRCCGQTQAGGRRGRSILQPRPGRFSANPDFQRVGKVGGRPCSRSARRQRGGQDGRLEVEEAPTGSSTHRVGRRLSSDEPGSLLGEGTSRRSRTWSRGTRTATRPSSRPSGTTTIRSGGSSSLVQASARGWDRAASREAKAAADRGAGRRPRTSSERSSAS